MWVKRRRRKADHPFRLALILRSRVYSYLLCIHGLYMDYFTYIILPRNEALNQVTKA